MFIEKLVVKNFKKFDKQEFDFNKKINVIVGDNESGKSTLLEAIEICTSCLYRGKPLRGEISTSLFHKDSISDYLAGPKTQDTLPEILIEAHVSGLEHLRGDNNSLSKDAEGLFVRIFLDTDLVDQYAAFAANPDRIQTLPVEFYTFEWFAFSWAPMNRNRTLFNCLFLDTNRLHPSFGRVKYINNILDATLGKKSRSSLNLSYRQLKARFDEQDDVSSVNNKLDSENEITNKSLKITADIASNTSWESGLQLAVDDVPFDHIGRGEQNQIQIKLALHNSANDVDVVLIEEPENHLSHMNLARLVSYIEKHNHDKQVFLTTHSSYVLNKLSINNICLLADEYRRLSEIDKSTVRTIKRLPGYDTLRVVLARNTILVEGPSDELVVKRLYRDKFDRLPEEDGIDIIVVRGIGFKNYLNIVKHLGYQCHVVKDNDGNYENNIAKWIKAYKDHPKIKCFSPTNNELNSLEPALIDANSQDKDKDKDKEGQKSLDRFACIALSTQTFNKYNKLPDLKEKKAFLNSWFKGQESGRRKVDSAIRIFECDKTVKFPSYLEGAIDFG